METQSGTLKKKALRTPTIHIILEEIRLRKNQWMTLEISYIMKRRKNMRRNGTVYRTLHKERCNSSTGEYFQTQKKARLL